MKTFTRLTAATFIATFAFAAQAAIVTPIDACKDHKSGDECSFTGKDLKESQSGTCTAVPKKDYLVCAPVSAETGKLIEGVGSLF